MDFQGKTEKQVKDSFTIVMYCIAIPAILFVAGFIIYGIGQWLSIWK